MNIEEILKNVSEFKNLVLDKVIIDYNENPIVYVFLDEGTPYLFAYFPQGGVEKWVGTKTTFYTIVQMLHNEIPVSDAIRDITNEKIFIIKEKDKIQNNIINYSELPSDVLPEENFLDLDSDDFEEIERYFEEKARYEILPNEIEKRIFDDIIDMDQYISDDNMIQDFIAELKQENSRDDIADIDDLDYMEIYDNEDF